MITLEELALGTPDGRPLAASICLSVPRGATQLVLGPSGCGKSRLLRIIAGTEPPLRGRVTVGGCAVWPGGGALGLIGKVRVGLAFAQGGLLSNLSLFDNAALPLRFLGRPEAEVTARTREALARVGLEAVAQLRPHAVSGSARKHGNLARLIALDPELILLDAPLEGLDAADGATAMGVIEAWAADPAKTLLVAQEEAAPFAAMATGRFDFQSHPAPREIP